MDLATLETRIAAYIDGEIMPALKGPSTLKKVGIAAVIAQAKSSGFINKYFELMANDPMFIALGVVDGEGNLGCTETICDSLKEAISATGEVTIPVIDMVFTADDIDVLRVYLAGESS